MLQTKNEGNLNKDTGDSPIPLYSEKQTPTNDLIKSTANRKKEQANTSCPKKFSMTEKIWGVLIRPSNRVQYDVSMLGPRCFLLSGKVMGRREDFQVRNSRGFLLECSYFEPTEVSNLKHPCLLYLHGNASSRLEGLHLLGSSVVYGFSLLLMDFAGCGLSQGEYISMSYFEKQDAKLVMDYVRNWKDVSEFGIWGRSMGAATALMTALEVDESIRYVVVDSCFVSVQKLCNEVVRSKVCLPSCMIDCAFGYVRRQVKQKAQFDLQQCDILQAVINSRKRTNLPSILFLAAKDDTLVKCTHSQQLFSAYSGAKQINIFEGTHNSRRPREILEQAGMFFYEGFFDEYAMSNLSPHKVEAEHLLFVDLKKAQENVNKGEKDSQNECLDKERNLDKKEQNSIRLEFKKKRRGLEEQSPQLSLPFSGKSNIPEQSQFVVSSQARMNSNLQQNRRSNTINHIRLRQNLGDGSNHGDDDKNEDYYLSRKVKINSRSNGNNQMYPNESNSSDSSFSDRSICRAIDPSKCKCTKLKRKTQSTQILKGMNNHKETATTVATINNQHTDGQNSEILPQSATKTGHLGFNNLIFSQPTRINLSTFSNVFSESPQLGNASNSPTRKKHISELPVFLNVQHEIDKVHPNSPQKQHNNTFLEQKIDGIENPEVKSGTIQVKNEESINENEPSNQEQKNDKIIKSKPTTSIHSREAAGNQENLRQKFYLVKRSFSKCQSNSNNQNSSLFHPSNNSAQTTSSIAFLPNNNKTTNDEINCQSYQTIDRFKPEGTIESDVFLDSQKRV